MSLETIRRYVGHESLKTTQVYVMKLKKRKVIEEIKNKDSFFGKWSEPNLNLGASLGKFKDAEVRE